VQIPRQLPQFKDRSALLIVAGRQDAIFYQVANGRLEALDDFKIQRPQLFAEESQRPARAEIIRDFLREFKRRLKFLPDCTEVWLFAPSRTKNELLRALPAPRRLRLRRVIPGNYYPRSPLELLHKLAA
jgi:hypothetical protein